jgi:membrane protein
MNATRPPSPMANLFERISRPLSRVSSFLKRVVEEWNADNATRWSASVAFYTLLSLAPLLILMVAMVGFLYGRDVAQGELVLAVRHLVSPDISPAVHMLLTHPQKPSTGLLAIVFGALILFFGASSMLAELHDALNAIWHVPINQNATEIATLFRLVKERLQSFLVIIGCGILLVVSLVLNSWLSALETLFSWRTAGTGLWLHLIVFTASFLAIAFVFAAIYKVIPNVAIDWTDVAVGGIATALLFVAGKQLISLYVRQTDLASAYGAAGSLIVVLVWVYYSAQVFFLGAEFTKVYAETFGSRPHKAEPVTSS